jgi:DNA-directed RNA polymerase specialized sigma24 family protein
LVLRYYLDFPEEEIAEILHCRPATDAVWCRGDWLG